jgi:hypothetical protein
VLDKTAGYMDRLMKEAIEVQLNNGNQQTNQPKS